MTTTLQESIYSIISTALTSSLDEGTTVRIASDYTDVSPLALCPLATITLHDEERLASTASPVTVQCDLAFYEVFAEGYIADLESMRATAVGAVRSAIGDHDGVYLAGVVCDSSDAPSIVDDTQGDMVGGCSCNLTLYIQF